MAALKSEELSPNVNGPSNCVDPLDIEQYINPESMSFPSLRTLQRSSHRLQLLLHTLQKLSPLSHPSKPFLDQATNMSNLNSNLACLWEQ